MGCRVVGVKIMQNDKKTPLPQNESDVATGTPTSSTPLNLTIHNSGDAISALVKIAEYIKSQPNVSSKDERPYGVFARKMRIHEDERLITKLMEWGAPYIVRFSGQMDVSKLSDVDKQAFQTYQAYDGILKYIEKRQKWLCSNFKPDLTNYLQSLRSKKEENDTTVKS